MHITSHSISNNIENIAYNHNKLNNKKSNFNSSLDKQIKIKKQTTSKKLTLPKNEIFKVPSDAITYVKNNIDFTNCTFDEYNKGMSIMFKNGVLPKPAVMTWIEVSVTRHVVLENKSIVTNPIYLKLSSNSKQNWFQIISELGKEQINLGNPYGNDILHSLDFLKTYIQ